MIYHYNLDGLLISETTSGGATIREYVYIDGQPLALLENGQVYYYHLNHLGTPQKLSDANQQVVWQGDYQPFGRANVVVNSVANNIRFPGQYFDLETEHYYNYYRDYDTTIGRYLSSDPIGLAGGMNTYGYVFANPPKYADPFGLKPSRSCVAATTALGAVCGGVLGFVGGGAVGGAGGTPVLPGAGTATGAVSGSKFGGAVGATLGGAAGNRFGNAFCPDESSCPPCKTVSGKTVPVGTIGYRPLDTPDRPQHGIDGPHFTILKANQIPKGNPVGECDCFWQPVGAVKPSDLPPNAIPVESFAN